MLDKIPDDQLEQSFRYLTITNLKSFHNYRTIGPNFKLYTSVLTNNNNVDNMIAMRITNDGQTAHTFKNYKNCRY